MYRSVPSACGGCNEVIAPGEADLTGEGERCWRCSTRSEVDSLYALVASRAWRQHLWRAGVVGYFLCSLGASLAITLSVPPLSLVEMLLAAHTLDVMQRKQWQGSLLATAQLACIAIATAAAGWIVLPTMAVGVLAALVVSLWGAGLSRPFSDGRAHS